MLMFFLIGSLYLVCGIVVTINFVRTSKLKKAAKRNIALTIRKYDQL